MEIVDLFTRNRFLYNLFSHGKKKVVGNRNRRVRFIELTLGQDARERATCSASNSAGTRERN